MVIKKRLPSSGSRSWLGFIVILVIGYGHHRMIKSIGPEIKVMRNEFYLSPSFYLIICYFTSDYLIFRISTDDPIQRGYLETTAGRWLDFAMASETEHIVFRR